MRSTASALSKLSLLFSPLDIRRFCKDNDSDLMCARLDEDTAVVCSNVVTSATSSNKLQEELDDSRGYAAPSLSGSPTAHALQLTHHEP